MSIQYNIYSHYKEVEVDLHKMIWKNQLWHLPKSLTDWIKTSNECSF